MAALRHVLQRSRTQLFPFINTLCLSEGSFTYQGRRLLFSREYLGLDNYERQRMITADRLGDVKDKFCARMEEYISGDPPGTVFTDDLKTMLHVTESAEDFQTTEKMFRQHMEQNKEMPMMGQFSFGPVIMRLLYSMNKPDIAFRLFFDESLDGHFDNASSFLLLLDTLYESGEYEKMLEVFELIQKKEIRGLKYPVDSTTLAVAACYRLNSEDSFNKLMEIFTGCRERRVAFTSRTASFAAKLALNQNRPDAAMELLVTKNEERLMTCQNIKAVALARLGRIEDSLQILRNVLQRDVPQQFRRGNELFSDTVTDIEKSLEKCEDEQFKRQFQTVKQKLVNGGHISNKTLHEFITQPIVKQRQMQSSFKSRWRSEDQFAPRYERPGLSDMV